MTLLHGSRMSWLSLYFMRICHPSNFFFFFFQCPQSGLQNCHPWNFLIMRMWYPSYFMMMEDVLSIVFMRMCCPLISWRCYSPTFLITEDMLSLYSWGCFTPWWSRMCYPYFLMIKDVLSFNFLITKDTLSLYFMMMFYPHVSWWSRMCYPWWVPHFKRSYPPYFLYSFSLVWLRKCYPYIFWWLRICYLLFLEGCDIKFIFHNFWECFIPHFLCEYDIPYMIWLSRMCFP